MLIAKPLPCVMGVVGAVDKAIQAYSPGHGLSTIQVTRRQKCALFLIVVENRIQNGHTTEQSFIPRYAIELTPSGLVFGVFQDL